MKKLFTSLLLGLAMLLGLFSSASAQQWSGTLYTDGTGGFDFVTPYSAPIVVRSDIDKPGFSKSSEASFAWSDAGTITAPNTEHAIVAFVQGENPAVTNSPYQGANSGQRVFTHGIGAFVGKDGLALEGWIGNGEAVVFSQNQRCMTYVKAGTVDCSINLGTNKNQIYPGWIDAAPGFVLDKSKIYVVSINMSNPNGGPNAELRATLWQTSKAQYPYGGYLPIQTAGITFTTSGFLPYIYEPVRRVFARTPSGVGPSANLTTRIYWSN